MKLRLLLLLVLLVSHSVQAEKRLSKSDFTNGFFNELKSQMPNDEFQILGDLRLKALDINDHELVIFLDNAYSSYLAGQREIDAIYADQISSIKNKKLSFSNNDINSILPVLKSKAYMQTVTQQVKERGGAETDFPFYFEQLNNDLYVMYVFDSPASMRSVSPDFVAKQGLEKNIKSLASSNLDTYYREAGVRFSEVDTQGSGRVLQFVADQNYEASLVASLSFWEEKRLDVDGDLVVFIPARNLVYIVGSNDSSGLQFASEVTSKKYLELGYSISPHGYILVDGSWQKFKH